MTYHIRFDGFASVELTRLLHTLERNLNLTGVQALGATDSSTATASVVPDCELTKTCPHTTPPGHGPVLATAAIALAVGAVGGYVLGKRSKTGSRN